MTLDRLVPAWAQEHLSAKFVFNVSGIKLVKTYYTIWAFFLLGSIREPIESWSAEIREPEEETVHHMIICSLPF